MTRIRQVIDWYLESTQVLILVRMDSQLILRVPGLLVACFDA